MLRGTLLHEFPEDRLRGKVLLMGFQGWTDEVCGLDMRQKGGTRLNHTGISRFSMIR